MPRTVKFRRAEIRSASMQPNGVESSYADREKTKRSITSLHQRSFAEPCKPGAVDSGKFVHVKA